MASLLRKSKIGDKNMTRIKAKGIGKKVKKVEDSVDDQIKKYKKYGKDSVRKYSRKK